MKLLNFAQGWKTYATVAVGMAVAVAQYFGYHIPWVVDFGLGMLGIGFHRAGTAQETKDTLAALQSLAALYKDVSSQIIVPDASAPKVVVPLGTHTIVVGEQSPKNVQEVDITAALNKAQLAK